jgi:hypothetical protein
MTSWDKASFGIFPAFLLIVNHRGGRTERKPPALNSDAGADKSSSQALKNAGLSQAATGG